jgi:hypothetical protein
MTKQKNAAVRFAPAIDRDSLFPSTGKWYVLDMLFAESFEKDPKKGLFRTKAMCEKACAKLNAKEMRHYVRLENGYVGIATGWSLEKGYLASRPLAVM